jgi:hypothetical protein
MKPHFNSAEISVRGAVYTSEFLISLVQTAPRSAFALVHEDLFCAFRLSF